MAFLCFRLDRIPDLSLHKYARPPSNYPTTTIFDIVGWLNGR